MITIRSPGAPDRASAPERGVLVRVRHLRVSVLSSGEWFEAVHGINFDVHAGRSLGVVGESGSGKTLTALSLLALVPRGARITGGTVHFRDTSILDQDFRGLQRFRATHVGYVPQDPQAALHPSFRVSRQIVEGLARSRSHRKELLTRACDILRDVGIGNPRAVVRRFPHELSGGMKQRIVVAAALLREPDLLIADEPTSSLDVTIQAQFVEHLLALREHYEFALVFVSHDLGVVSNVCDDVVVMYAGEIVERGPAESLLISPAHPYNKALVEAAPSVLREDQPGSWIPGRPPLPSEDLSGCRFAPRCPAAHDRCHQERPVQTFLGSGRSASCWLLEEAQ